MPPRIHGVLYPPPSEGLPLLEQRGVACARGH